MQSKRDVLQSFKFKRVQYYAGGKILESKFTQNELDVLESMNVIASKPVEKAVEVKKEKKKKNANKA